jgi:amino acid adenylation domain-containing protein
LLRKAREVSLGAFAHQDAPFEKLVEELHPERSLGRSPLFQVMLDLQTAPLELPQMQDLRLKLFPIDTQTAKFDLALTLSPTGEGLDAALEYSTDIFAEATARRLAANFVTLLEAIVEQPESRISRLPLPADAEKREMQEWNNTELKFEGAAPIHRVFERQAQQVPAGISVICGGRSLRYEQLNSESNRLARHLQRLGVGPETLIGICLERSPEMPLAILAVLKAGGAYVPLDPTYPPERLAFMIKDAGLRAVITNSTFLPRLKETYVDPICLDAVNDAIAAESEENCHASPLLDNAAYVIYTSGSTGSPRGVIVSHRNLIHSTFARTAYYREPVGAFLLLPSFSFDSSIAGLFWTLSQGGKLVIPEEGGHQDPAALAQLIERHSVSHLLCLPTLYRLLLEQQRPGLNSLRTVIVAGEPCPADLVSLHRERLPQASLFNEYGPTEATVWTTVFDCSSTARAFTVPIGRPIANTRVYLLDRHSQPVPAGATGELYIGGDGVSRGYLNRPELTAERFVPDLFSSTPGARLYKSGDLGRYLHDGTIEFEGRNDFQVKVRGYRIEPGEIELALKRHPSVHQAVVVADEKGLKAFVKLRPEVNASPVELRSYLKSKLPDYMVPGFFIFADLFPFTANGKIDRQALIQTKAPEAGRVREYVAPQTALEQLLAAIFADVLGVDRVGLFDNFFEMGGHSLMATQAASRVHEALGVELPLRRIFEMPSVELLANAILNQAADPIRIQRTAELMLRVSHVSDEEAEALLEKGLSAASKEQFT